MGAADSEDTARLRGAGGKYGLRRCMRAQEREHAVLVQFKGAGEFFRELLRSHTSEYRKLRGHWLGSGFDER